MSNAHTPGPWNLARGKNSVSVCFSGSAGVELVPWGNENLISKADAQLIAAAPEMLEALQLLLPTIEALAHSPVEYGRELTTVRAAIAKATGGDL